MAIKVRCPGCRQKIRFSGKHESHNGRCPRCFTIVIESAADPDDDPAASHGAIVPRPHQSRPRRFTAAPPPPPALPFAAPAPCATLPWKIPHAVLPRRRPILFRLGTRAIGAFRPSPRTERPDFLSLLGLDAALPFMLFGTTVFGLWLIVILSQFR